jgi:hypothetical protein
MTTDTASVRRPLDLENLVLASGSHNPTDGEMCLEEAAAYMAGEPWSDHPQCACPVLAAFGRDLNDRLPDDKRQLLKPFIAAQIGTRGDGYAETRSYMALDWLIRTYLPAWLSLSERIDPAHAAALRALPPIVDMASAQAAGVLVREARSQASAAWDAAGAAAGAAAWDAAGAAARDAARAAAGAAAWDAAGAAAWDAAGAAAWDAAGAAAGAAAWDAATTYLAPTVSELQDSAIELFARMCRIGHDTDG